jgi:NADH-quinone oxidoreductase subunit N
MLSLAGFPPTAGFLGKFLLFRHAYDAGLLWLVVVSVLNSVVSAYYYLGVVVRMYGAEPAVDQAPAWTRGIAGGLLVVALVFAVIGVIVGGIAPARMLDLVGI